MTDAAPAPATAFRDRLHALTPHVVVMPAIIAANVVMFGVELARGAAIMSPTTEALLANGANYGPLTTGGEWWRLASSMFVHVGILHVAMNMLVLVQIGGIVERLVGNVAFLLLYLATGVLASLTSLAWNPNVVSAGASGAVFGCYGIFLGILLRNRAAIPPEVRRSLLRGATAFILYNVVYGFSLANIDQAAHFGGLASGVLAGVAVALPLTPEAAPRRLPRAVLVAAVAAAVAVGIAFALPRTGDWMAELRAIEALEKRINGEIADAQKRAKEGTLDDASFARILREKIIPEWAAQRERLTAVRGLRGQMKDVGATAVKYVDAKLRGFTLYAEALEQNDKDKLFQAKAAFDHAERIARSLSGK